MRPFAPFRRIARVWDYLLGNAPAAPKKRRNRLGFEALEARDVPTTVSIEALNNAVEGGDLGVFRLYRDGDLSDALTVNLSVGGNAGNGLDNNWVNNTVTFGIGEDYVDVSVDAVEDGVYDPGETVTVEVVGGDGYDVDAGNNTAGVDIFDRTAATFTVNSADGTVWYELPWDQVDANEATQSLPLYDFRLLYGGEYFDEGSADFSAQPPTAEFAFGELVDIKFTAVLPDAVGGVSKLVVDGGSVTAFDAGNDQVGDPADLQKKAKLSLVRDAGPDLNPQGRPIPGFVRVGVAWVNAPNANGNGIKYELIDATTGKTIPNFTLTSTYQTEAIPNNPNFTSAIQAPSGRQVKVVMTLIDGNGTALDSVTSSAYLVP